MEPQQYTGLDERAQVVAGVVHGLKVPEGGWDEPRVRTALCLHLLVERAELVRIQRERFCVQLRLCTLERLVRSCQIGTGGGSFTLDLTNVQTVPIFYGDRDPID